MQLPCRPAPAGNLAIAHTDARCNNAPTPWLAPPACNSRFFDPAHYRIVLVDQRGCGRSSPAGCLADNTTAALVEDLEALRRHLALPAWVMLGGSWGVALALAYAQVRRRCAAAPCCRLCMPRCALHCAAAPPCCLLSLHGPRVTALCCAARGASLQAHPSAVLGLVLRGVCLMRPREIAWMYGGGAGALKPLAWRAFVGHLEAHEAANPLLGYYRRLLSDDAAVRSAAVSGRACWLRVGVCACRGRCMHVCASVACMHCVPRAGDDQHQIDKHISKVTR